MPVPSAANMKFKFSPTFNAMDDAGIEFAIEEAAVECGPEGTFGQFGWVDDVLDVLNEGLIPRLVHFGSQQTRQMVVGVGEKIVRLRQVSHVYPPVLPLENRCLRLIGR